MIGSRAANHIRNGGGRRAPDLTAALDPSLLSPAEGLAFSQARDAARRGGRPMPSLEEFLSGRRVPYSRDLASGASPAPFVGRPAAPVASACAGTADSDRAVIAPSLAPSVVTLHRIGDCAAGAIALAPRTKKNSTELGIRQSASYRKYKASVLDSLTRSVEAIGALPAGIEYNVCAHFYPDQAGARSDANNFYAALADLLENAGLVANDHQFRRWWGSDVIQDHCTTPRTEFVIAPIATVAVTVAPSLGRLLSTPMGPS